MLLTTNQITPPDLLALNILAQDCNEVDGGYPNLYMPILLDARPTENNILYYRKEKLIGFLSVFFFYVDACELSLLVHPSERRKGLAKQLIQTILPLLKSREMKKIIFSSTLIKDPAWLLNRGFVFKSREYQMQRIASERCKIKQPQLKLYKASMLHIAELCELDRQCFAIDSIDMVWRFENILKNPAYTILIAYLNAKAIGKIHMNWEKEEVIFSDIAILPAYQKRGLGTELVAQAINYVSQRGSSKITLDVETTNQQALNLYFRHNFAVKKIHDYWIIPLEELSKQL